MRYLFCILGIHKYTRLLLYAPYHRSSLKKCRACGRKIFETEE